MKVAIIGASGYAGAELIRLIMHHPNLELEMIISSQHVGRSLHTVYKHLSHYPLTFEAFEHTEIVKRVDLIFFATPPGISGKWAQSFVQAGKYVVDLSGDFRLESSSTYEKWYQLPAPQRINIQPAVYGLSEWFRESIQRSPFISNPGCFPTASLLALAPLLNQQAISTTDIFIDAKSGISGAGRKVLQPFQFSESNENLRAYKALYHQHIPEIEQIGAKLAKEEIRVQFVPHLVPMNRGILVTIYVTPLLPLTDQDLVELYHDAYRHAPFVRIRSHEYPTTKEVHGSNYCDIGFFKDDRTHRIILFAAIDNLMKGAASQAIQNINIRMGWKEECGLHFMPLYP
nr:N-acetyl-gamma-glutamyl-phosphate reductase [Polycladospora coralii]